MYRRAQMQIDKILDPTASVPSVFIEPRKRWGPQGRGRVALPSQLGLGGCRVGAGPLKTSQRGFYTDRRCGCALPGRPEPCRVIPVCGRAALTLRPSPLSPPNVSLHLMSPQRPHSEMLGTLSFSGPAPWLPGPSTTSARSPPGPSPPVLGHQVALSWCPRPLVPKRRGIFFNTALIRIFLHSKPAMVPRGTRAPVTGGACLSIPTAPHHTASRGTCRSRSRWPRAPEPSSVLPFLSLLVGPPHTLFPHPSSSYLLFRTQAQAAGSRLRLSRSHRPRPFPNVRLSQSHHQCMSPRIPHCSSCVPVSPPRGAASLEQRLWPTRCFYSAGCLLQRPQKILSV